MKFQTEGLKEKRRKKERVEGKKKKKELLDVVGILELKLGDIVDRNQQELVR